MKLTKRKAFNFLRSYFDVLNELNTDEDKLSFLMAIINKQFLDEDPKDLNFLVNLCYQSQRHAIEKSVKGWQMANGTPPPKGDPKGSGKGNPKGDPKEEKEQYVIDFESLLAFINEKTGRKFKVINNKVKGSYKARLKDGYKKIDILNAIINATSIKHHKENNYQYLTPEFFSRADTLDKYSYTPKIDTKQERTNNLLNNF